MKVAATSDYLITETQRALVVLESGQLDSAISMCSNIVSQSNFGATGAWVKANVFQLRGLAYERKQSHDLALKDYETAIRLNPGNAFALQHMSAICVEHKIDKLADAQSMLLHSISVLAEYSEFLHLLAGDVAIRMERYMEAIRLYSKVLEKNPNHMIGLVASLSAYLNLDMFEEAVVFADRALELVPKSSAVLYLRGTAYCGLEKFDLGFIDFDTAVKNKDFEIEIEGLQLSEFNPERCYAHKIQIYSRQKNYVEALKCCDEALTLANPKLLFFQSRAELLYRLQRWRESLDAYHAALSMDFDPLRSAQIHGQLAILYSRLNESGLALKEIDAALKLKPANGLAHNNKAWMLAHLGRFKEAANSIAQAVTLDPDSPNYLSTRGLIRYLQGDSKGALTDFDKALNIRPHIPEAQFFRAKILKKEGFEVIEPPSGYQFPIFSILKKLHE